MSIRTTENLNEKAMEVIKSVADREIVERENLKDLKGFYISTIETQPKNVMFLQGIKYNGRIYYLCHEINL